MTVDADDIGLASQVLTMLGDKGVSDFTSTKRGAICGELYEDAKVEFINSYPWSCTIKRAQLSQSSTAPVNRWTYAYDLPGDRLGPPLYAYDSESAARPFLAWELIGATIQADVSFCFVVYQIDKAVRDWPEYMRHAFKGWLGALLADPITGTANRIELWEGRRERWGMAGRSRDSQVQPSKAITDFRLVDARHGRR